MPIQDWSAEAFNQSPDSANEIHGDKIAKQYGFKGGLVPGVTVSAYLMHPAMQAWGKRFLEQGRAHVRVGSPLYDEEQFSVRITSQSDTGYQASLLRPDDTASATADVELMTAAPPAPARRGDPVAEKDYVGPAATPERWQELKDQGCHAFRYRFSNEHRMSTYLRDKRGMPDLLVGDAALANMGFILGISNWVLSSNAHMNPWVHLETWSQNYSAIAMNTVVVAEMQVADFYEKKGHQFVDANIALFNEADNTCTNTITLRAIYRLRGM